MSACRIPPSLDYSPLPERLREGVRRIAVLRHRLAMVERQERQAEQRRAHPAKRRAS